MKSTILFLCIIAASAPVLDAGEPPKGFSLLFDGKSLEGWWTEKENHFWSVDGNGSLARTAPQGQKGGGYIWTDEKFGDFVLDLEFKMSESCNSGVFIRTNPDSPVQEGFEIQVFDSAGKEDLEKHDCGALYDAVVPSVNACRPAGEWNHLRITCDGPKVVVELNGKTVVTANLDEWTTPNQNPDGTKNKFGTALKELPRSGNIGLQDHGHDVWFRNVYLKKL